MDLPQGINMLVLDRAKIQNLWEIVRKYPSTFADGTKDPETFAERLLASDSLVFELEGGLVLVEKIVPGLKAQFHATFWDQKLSSRKEILQELLVWVFLTFHLERLETFVVSYARAVRRFLQDKLHFKHEGTLRNTFWNQGQLYSMDIYSILKSEVLNG